MRAVGESPAAIAAGSLLYCHFEDEAWAASMHHYMLESGNNAAVDGWWTDFGGAPAGSFTGNAEWQCSHDSQPVGISGPMNASFEPGHGDIDLGFYYGNGMAISALFLTALASALLHAQPRCVDASRVAGGGSNVTGEL